MGARYFQSSTSCRTAAKATTVSSTATPRRRSSSACLPPVSSSDEDHKRRGGVPVDEQWQERGGRERNRGRHRPCAGRPLAPSPLASALVPRCRSPPSSACFSNPNGNFQISKRLRNVLNQLGGPSPRRRATASSKNCLVLPGAGMMRARPWMWGDFFSFLGCGPLRAVWVIELQAHTLTHGQVRLAQHPTSRRTSST